MYIGNSTVHFGINPYYIDNITKLKSYNLGYGGANIETMSMLFYGYLQQHPKAKDRCAFNRLFNTCAGTLMKLTFFFILSIYLQNQYADAITLKQIGYKVEMADKSIAHFLKYSYFDDYNRTSVITGLFHQSLFERNAIVYNGFLSNTNDSVNSTNLEADKKPLADKKYRYCFINCLIIVSGKISA